VTQQYNGVDNKRFFLIEAGSAKQAWQRPTWRRNRIAALFVVAVATVIAVFVKNGRSQKHTRTTEFVTAAGR
jgi:hypothetical protein